jgi:thioredoxin-related protein
MEGKDVAFVFMCVDSNEKQWKAILSKFGLGGQHFLLNKNQSHDFRQVFKVNGIPHYILFDKNGNIVENGTGRPAEVNDKIDKLLN